MFRLITGKEAAAKIHSGDHLCIIGNISLLEPETVLYELEQAFLKTGAPRDLTIMFPVFIGSMENRGIDYFAHKGMVKRAIGGSFASMGPNKKFNDLIFNNEVEAYQLPMGSFYKLLQNTGAGQPGLFTKVGLDTQADPRMGGGKFNAAAKEDLVQVKELDGAEYLYYPRLKVDVSIIRGTSVDDKGNIYLEDEPTSQGILAIALAAKNNGGIVIAQVRRQVQTGSVHPKLGMVPGKLVDYVVLDERDEASVSHHEAYTYGSIRQKITPQNLPLNHRKVILRRMALELKKGFLVNLGFGIPVGLPNVAVEEDIWRDITFTIEHGPIGGLPGWDGTFAVAVNPEMILDSVNLFDLYTCGMLDMSCLGMGEADQYGNVNNHKFKNMIAGAGGFIDITYKTPNIIFGATFTAGGLKTEIVDGGLHILQEGRIRKFSSAIEGITFNAKQAWKKGQQVWYVTERAVFRLGERGLVLTEVAPGIDLQKQVLDLLDFKPEIDPNLRLMDERIFRPEAMKIELT